MKLDHVSRRSVLKTAGSLGMVPEAAFAFQNGGPVRRETAAAAPAEEKPKYSIRFGIIGLDHVHIYGITGALLRGGGVPALVYSNNARLLADFEKRFPGIKRATSEDEILNDPSIQLVASASIPDLRAPLGMRAMRHGKDFLCDKPGIISLEQLAEVRRTIRETNRMFAILYSERLEVRAAVHAGDLVRQGAIGRVVQTVHLAPHQLNEAVRPDWFWDPARYGGILTDIGSHQVDEFLYYTGSSKVDIGASRVANVNHKHREKFQDFGEMLLHGDSAFGYVRVDWFTPDGLGTWGDGRVFILGTEGYIELRKYIDIGGRKGLNHLFLVDRQATRYIDCSRVELPFGPRLVADVVNRTHTAQDQEQTLLATETVLKAQKSAQVL